MDGMLSLRFVVLRNSLSVIAKTSKPRKFACFSHHICKFNIIKNTSAPFSIFHSLATDFLIFYGFFFKRRKVRFYVIHSVEEFIILLN